MTIKTPNGFTLDNSGQRIVVDPVTRIEGHLRIEVNVDEANVILTAHPVTAAPCYVTWPVACS